MLQIKDIRKQYKTGNLIQKALDGVSLNLRDNEFVAILGPSGSGKTTLLNIIGGLDRYDSGNLIINGISTKNYKDRDWDSYRNHTIGFVFQSYNLIPHQNILSNVELALTISGISKSERRKRAIHALTQVGLKEQIHKKPNQMSGGQMQRVAIARALVNDPDILLADEPTGALDSDTSVQVMDLLKEVAKDRLVVMVTHNPELAEQYANRIVNLRDGKIISDTNAFVVDETHMEAPKHKNMGKTSMSLLTSLSLSFNNLKTKKGRTILTSFAGSIGIIGIALILSLSNGVNNYIKNVEEETLSEYPLIIQSSGFDMTSMLSESAQENEVKTDGDIGVGNMMTNMFSTIGANDLESLKIYLDSNKSNIKAYTNAIEYAYPVIPQIYSNHQNTIRQVHPDQSFNALGLGSSNSSNSMMSSMMSTDVFKPLPTNENLYTQQYDIKAGRWAKNKNECVLILTSNGNVMDFLLYTLGLRDAKDLDKMISQFAKEEEVDVPLNQDVYNYDDILGISFKVVNAFDYYEYDETYHIWKNKMDDVQYMNTLVNSGEDLTIVGIVQPKEGSTAAMLGTGIYYTSDLVDHTIKNAANSDIVKAQLQNPSMNVFTNKAFDDKDQSNGFDMSSLFTIDESKLNSAFSMDTSKLKVDANQFNNLASQMQMPNLNVSNILSQIKLDIAPEQMEGIFKDLMDGYEVYMKDHPQNSMEVLLMQLTQYLQSNEASQIVKEGIEEAIKENGEIVITNEQMQGIIRDVMQGYDAYAKEHDFIGMETINLSFVEYLKSQEAKQIISSSMDKIMQSIDIDQQIMAIMQTYMGSYMESMGVALQNQLEVSMQNLSASMAQAMHFDANAFSSAISMNMSERDMSELMMSMMSKERYSYEDNLKRLGYADVESPSQISIYPKDFESKEQVLNILDDYNERMEKVDEDKVITYTDVVGTLMSSVTDIVNVISYVLVAFVAISLVVSSIMIGVITYISVLERKKEIGILRAIGASKRNISEVFNAETFIVGLLAGVIGIVITLLLLIPANQVIHSIAGQQNINASLPLNAGIILIILSTVLTLIGGIIPSRKAAKEDPVTALRTE